MKTFILRTSNTYQGRTAPIGGSVWAMFELLQVLFCRKCLIPQTHSNLRYTEDSEQKGWFGNVW